MALSLNALCMHNAVITMVWKQATSHAEHRVYITWCIEVAWTADHLKRRPVLVGGVAAYIFPKFPVPLWENWADS